MLAEALAGGETPEPIGIEALAARVAAAAQRAKDLGVALGPEAGLAMPVLARALTGDPAGLPRPETVPPWEDDDPELIVDAAEDESGFHGLVDRLLDELEEWTRASCRPDGPMWRSGDFVASAMLEWKGGYGDGRLGRWTGEDLAEFLLDYFPRKVSVHGETVEDVVDCVISVLGFLDQRESLSGEPLEVLEEACDELRAEFLTAQADPASWGLAKSMFMQMRAEGVDLEDPAAIEGWMADFNERPRADRDAVIGGAADRMLAWSEPPTGPGEASEEERSTAQVAAGGAQAQPPPVTAVAAACGAEIPGLQRCATTLAEMHVGVPRARAGSHYTCDDDFDGLEGVEVVRADRSV